MTVIRKFLRGLDYVEELILVALLVFMTALNFVNVCSRYLLHASLSMTDELTVMAFVWCTMIGAATAYKRGAHLGMSFIVERFPKKGQALFAAFSLLCSLVMLALLLKMGLEMVQNQIKLGQATPALRLPACWQGLSIPVGAVLMIIRSLQFSLAEIVRLWKEGGKAA